MKIDLNAVLNLVKPQPATFELDGKSYPLKRLTIADVKAMEVAAVPQEGDDGNTADQRVFDLAATFFEGEPPPPLVEKLAAIADDGGRDEARLAALAIYGAIVRVFDDQRSKTYALAQQETNRQISAQRAATVSTT